MSSPVGVTGPVKCVNNPIFMVDGAGGGVGAKVKKATLIPTAAITIITAIIIAVVLALIIHQAQNQEVSGNLFP
jgi:hypothetical protein